MQKTLVSGQGTIALATDLVALLEANARQGTHGDRDPAFFTLLSILCTQFLPNVQVKDVLGTLPHNHHRSTGERLLASAMNLGFMAKVHRGGIGRMKAWECPALLVAEEGDEVFLLLGEGSGARAFDGEGIRAIDGQGSACDLATLPRGTIHRLQRDPLANPLAPESRKHTGHNWLRALFTQFGEIRWIVVCTTLAIVLVSICQPFVISSFYRSVFSRGDEVSMPWLLTLLLMLVATMQVMMGLRAHALAWLAARLNYLVGCATFDKMMHLPAVLTQRLDAKDQSSRVRSFESVSDFLTSPLAAILLDLPVSVLGLLLVTWVMPPAGVVLILAGLLYGQLFFMAGRRMRVLTSMLADQATELQHVMVETFEKRDLIRECGLQHRWADLQEKRIARTQGVQYAVSRLTAIVEGLASFFFAVAFILVIGVVAVWGPRYQLGAAGLLGVILLTSTVLAPLHALCLALPRFEQCSKSLAQINAFMDLESEAVNDTQRRRLPVLHGNAALRNITMRIGAGRPLLFGLDIQINAGDIVGISGAAGTGKSTILHLLQGLTQPSFGVVQIEGVDLEQLPLRTLRSAIGYIPQKPSLLPGSLRDNLTMANPIASPADIERALSTVGLTDLPLDEFQVTEKTHLPEGFIWRFAMAQALIAGTGLILIDEIPNAVVNAGFDKIFHNILRSAKGRVSVVFVSGRSDLLALADRVILLRQGNAPVVTTPEALADAA
jgi:ATP-binding cassette, subfamily C, bacterial LapB